MGKTERFSLSFTVNNFSEVKGDLLSPPVIAHNLKWRILIKPSNIGQKKSLGYYLQCDGPDGGSKASSWSCQANAELKVIAAKQGVDIFSLEISHLFKSESNNCGYKDYMDWADIESTERGLIQDNSITFLVLITADEPQQCERCKERFSKSKRFSLSFTVNNFSELKEDLLSPPVIMHNLKWRIKIKPISPGMEGLNVKSLGYFLRCEGPDGGSEASSWSCQAIAKLEVIAAKQGVDNYSREISSLFNSKIISFGYKDYIDWADVESTERGLIKDNSVTFLVHIMADEPQRCERCEERTCKVCLKEEVNICFDPCGHLSTCTKCSSALNECPICRGKINKKIQVFV